MQNIENNAAVAATPPRPDRHQLIFQSLEAFLVAAIGEEEYSRLKTVVEFGCGKTGYVAKYLRPGRTCIGIDLHDYSAYWKMLGVHYRISDGVTIPLENSSVNLVVSHSVVEHVENLPNSLSEINRVLKRGGVAYITVSPLYTKSLRA